MSVIIHKKLFIYCIIVTLFITFSFLTCRVCAQDIQEGGRTEITDIKVENNKAVSTNTILSKIKSRTGNPFLQKLVNEDIKVYNPHKDGIVYDSQAVKQKYGIGPEHIVDMLALSGDASDNIPGVPGVGQKTAVKLLTEYGSLDNILTASDRIKGKLGENLRENSNQAADA